MGRVSCLLVVAFCVSAATVRGHPWFPDPWEPSPSPPVEDTPPPLYPSPTTPSPYYDAPPYMSDPPVQSPPYASDPPSDGPEPSPWFSCSIWAKKTEFWPAPYTADTSVEEALGPDAMKVYGQMSMLDGILSKGEDGYSDLLKQGITALLNCVDKHFKYTEDEIKKCFSFKTALSSEASASLQARLFEDANEEYSS